MVRHVLSTAGAVVAATAATVLVTTSAWAAESAPLVQGPVPVPTIPLRVCVGATCESTPPVTSVTMSLSVEASPTATAGTSATAVARPCGNGTGVAAEVSGGTAASVLTGTLTLDLGGGRSALLPIRRTVAANAPTTIVRACTS